MTRHYTIAALALMMFAGTSATAQPPASEPRSRQDASQYPRPTSFPNEDKAKVGAYLATARRIAGQDLFPDFVHRCILDARFRRWVDGEQYNGVVEPEKVFDQLYFVGQNAVSAWALVTSGGIVLFDALNNEDEAKNLLIPNLKAIGLDPANVKYVVITHSHGDHYGGAEYLKRTLGARLVASEEDWRVMDEMRASGKTGPFPVPPPRDMAVRDGQTLKVGETTLTFSVTPGHTPGTLSTIFPVTDHGQRHVVAFFGGFGPPRDPQMRYTHIASMNRFAGLAAAAGADAMIANHPVQDGSYWKLELLRYPQTATPNPYVIGADRLRRYLELQVACSKVGLLRAGLDPEARR